LSLGEVLFPGVDQELKTGKQRCGVGFAASKILNAPFFPLPPMNPERRLFRIVARIYQPIFPDARDVEMQFDIADQVFFRVAGQDFADQDRADVLPAHRIGRCNGKL